MLDIIKKLLLILAAAYGMTALLLYVFQDRLIFFQQPISEERLQYIDEAYPESEEISITTRDNTKLHGWLLHRDASEESPLIIYFGGNAQEVTSFLEESHHFPGWSVLTINYRGYGLSEGKPSEKKLFSDSLDIFDYIYKRDKIDKDRIVAMGRSLGAGVAVYLASERGVDGLILVSPYNSIKDVAKRQFPVFPVSYLIKHPFDSISLAPQINIPTLAIIASEDNVIDPEHSYRLLEEWGGQYQLEIIQGMDHNNLHLSQNYWEAVNKFLAKYSNNN